MVSVKPLKLDLSEYTDMISLDALAACSFYLAKNGANSGFVLRHVTLRAKELLASPNSASPLETLSRAQALLLYQIILAFDGDVRFSSPVQTAFTANESARYWLVYKLKSPFPSWRHMHLQSNPFSTREKNSSLQHFQCIPPALQMPPGKPGFSVNQLDALFSSATFFFPFITHSEAVARIAIAIPRLRVSGPHQRICGMHLPSSTFLSRGMTGDILLSGIWIICLCFWMGIRVRWIVLGGLSLLRR